ncbi:MAG: GGDEF domain-containing protein, partial [Myxococcota bacterium]
SMAGTRIGMARAVEKIQLQASTDPLTGLFNRRTLQERLDKLSEAKTQFALAVVDLDHFKQLNDTYGHNVGDQALSLFSTVVQQTLDNHGFAARYGGEEFVIVVPGVGVEGGTSVLEEIRTRLAAALHRSDTPNFTASYGIADSTFTPHPEALIRYADQALLDAKSTGRNRIVTAVKPNNRPQLARREDIGANILAEADHQDNEATIVRSRPVLVARG